ncbi:MAG: tyrosine-type recombinase/integrase, partial [Candidatus Puniceispirillales bacterium WSBS_2018_MAG_OTU23]
MTIFSLTPSKVLTAKKRKKPYIIRDQKLKGFHLKIYPSGRKTFAITCLRGGKQYNERIGDAAVMTLADARSIAITKIDALTLTAKACKAEAGISSLTDTSFSTLAEVVFSRHERRWKPATMKVNRYYLKNQLLPFFGGKNIASITRADVEIWLAGLSHITEGANRAVPVLSCIMQGAEELGFREEDSNPTLGLKRYKRYPRQCVLTDMEMARLGKLLDAEDGKNPRKSAQAAILRLIILTGCRKNEIMKLRWQDYRGGHLHLIDSKTGPKMVFLSSHARAILDGIKGRRGKFIFPSSHGKP